MGPLCTSVQRVATCARPVPTCPCGSEGEGASWWRGAHINQALVEQWYPVSQALPLLRRKRRVAVRLEEFVRVHLFRPLAGWTVCEPCVRDAERLAALPLARPGAQLARSARVAEAHLRAPFLLRHPSGALGALHLGRAVLTQAHAAGRLRIHVTAARPETKDHVGFRSVHRFRARGDLRVGPAAQGEAPRGVLLGERAPALLILLQPVRTRDVSGAVSARA
jgi:hypothetical protein